MTIQCQKLSLCNQNMRQDCKLPVFSVVASVHLTVPFKHWLEKKSKPIFIQWENLVSTKLKQIMQF